MKRRRRVLVAATLAVVVCAVGYLSAAIGHRLDHGTSRWHGADANARTEWPTAQLRVAFNPGGQVTFGVSIRNPGPWPATITGITVDDGPADHHVFKIARLAVNHADKSTAVVFDPAAATPFRPTTVGADMELPVFITITLPNVQMAPGSGLFFEDLAVDYDVLGLPRHQRVPMGFRLLVHSPNGPAPR